MAAASTPVSERLRRDIDVSDEHLIEDFENEARRLSKYADDYPFDPYEDLSEDKTKSIADRIRQWQQARNAVWDASAEVEETRAVSHDEQDVLAYAFEEEALLQALEKLRDTTSDLIEERGAEWQDKPSSRWLQELLRNNNKAINRQRAIHRDVLATEQAKLRVHTAQAKLRTKGILQKLGEDWVGSWILGSGGFGVADLFVKFEDGCIVDRVVVKDAFHLTERHKENIWFNRELWSNGGPEDEGSIPNEVQAMYNLRSRKGASSVLKIRGYLVRRQHYMYRTYTEFCPFGELRDLIRYEHVYGCCDERFDNRKGDKSNDPAVRMIPEVFVWWTFECLATAGLLMEKGELDVDDSVNPWDMIIHRDLKIGNIFVGSSNEDKYRGYPEPKVGDFGLALFMKPDDSRGPRDILPRGTPGTMAPETHWRVYEDGEDGELVQVPMSSKTNVYGMGIIIWGLLACEDQLPLGTNPDARDESWFEGYDFEPPKLDRTAQVYYSKDLRELAASCAKENPSDRPSFRQILESIERFRGGGTSVARRTKKEAALAAEVGRALRELRDAPQDHRLFEGDHQVDFKGRDTKYALGLAREDLPSGPRLFNDPVNDEPHHAGAEPAPLGDVAVAAATRRGGRKRKVSSEQAAPGASASTATKKRIQPARAKKARK